MRALRNLRGRDCGRAQIGLSGVGCGTFPEANPASCASTNAAACSRSGATPVRKGRDFSFELKRRAPAEADAATNKARPLNGAGANVRFGSEADIIAL